MEVDLRTLSIIRDVSNQLDTDIQLTIDVPSLNENGKFPVLDLEISMVQNIVKFEFYKKPISNPRVILYNSAISKRIERSVFSIRLFVKNPLYSEQKFS